MQAKATKAAVRSALATLNPMPLYTLEDVATHLERNPTTWECSMDCVKAVASDAECMFRDAADSLPKGHDAEQPLTRAADAMRQLCALVDLTDPYQTKPDAVQKRAMRAAISAFTGTAGRYMERAHEALGDSPHYGYLQGMCLAGGEGMTKLETPDSLILDRFNKLDDGDKADAAAYIATLVSRRTLK